MSAAGASGAASDGDVPDETTAAGRPRDVRVGSHRDIGVRVDRDLTGSGRLARGSTTGYSTLRFSSGPRAPAPAAAMPTTAADRIAADSTAVDPPRVVTEHVFPDVTLVTTPPASGAADLPSPTVPASAGKPETGRGARGALARVARWFGRV